MAYIQHQKYEATIQREGATEPEKISGHAPSAKAAKELVENMLKTRAQDGVAETITSLKFGDVAVIP